MPAPLKHFINYALIGMIAGLAAWGTLVLSHWVPSWGSLSSFVVHGLSASLGWGALLFAAEPVSKHHPVSEMGFRLLAGALLGALAGWLAFSLADILLAHQTPLTIARPFGWMVLGMLMSGVCSLFHSRTDHLLQDLLRGLLGGLIGGILVEIVALFPFDATAQLVALIAFGFGFQTTFAVFELFPEHAVLRLINGPRAGQSWLIRTGPLHLGYRPGNQVRISGYTEVCPNHAVLRREAKNWALQNLDSGGTLEVNFRGVQQQTLKDGDIIKVGSALLQYSES